VEGKIVNMFYTYVLKSVETGKLYVGKTANLRERLRSHFYHKVKTTKKWGKIRLVFYEAFLSEKDSVRREKYFKTSKGKASLRQIIRESLKNYE